MPTPSWPGRSHPAPRSIPQHSRPTGSLTPPDTAGAWPPTCAMSPPPTNVTAHTPPHPAVPDRKARDRQQNKPASRESRHTVRTPPRPRGGSCMGPPMRRLHSRGSRREPSGPAGTITAITARRSAPLVPVHLRARWRHLPRYTLIMVRRLTPPLCTTTKPASIVMWGATLGPFSRLKAQYSATGKPWSRSPVTTHAFYVGSRPYSSGSSPRP